MFARCLRSIAFCLALLSFARPLFAQVFSSEGTEKSILDAQGANGWERFYGVSSNQATDIDKSSVKSETKKTLRPPAKQEVVNPEDYIYKNVPQINRPTLDGVKRGRTSVVPVVVNKNLKAEGYIYVYYSDFSLGQMMNGSTTCDVKFQILTTLDRKLNSLAMRLKWQNMDTPLTFIDVNPNQQYHLTYTLLGDGCYSMDKIPNIVINRCRVKGMTQEDCAARVRWIKKVQ